MSKLVAALKARQAARPATKPAPAPPPQQPAQRPTVARPAHTPAPARAPATQAPRASSGTSTRSTLALADKYRKEQERLAREHAAELAKARGLAVKAQRELEAHRAQLQREKTRAALVSAARAAGAIDPEDVADLAASRAQWKLAGDKLTLATDPSKDAGAWVSEMLEAKPHLAARRTSAGGGALPLPSRGTAAEPPPANLNEAFQRRLFEIAGTPAPGGAGAAGKK